MARTGRPATRQVGAVQRAVDVLDALAEARTELGTNEIARRTGINVSSISRLLSTLTSTGLVQHVPSSGRYRLGVRILQLAGAARESLDVRAVARPYLEELTDLTGETATLSLPGEHDLLTVDFVQSRRSVRSVAEIGRNSVAHATAAGKVFLAWGGTLPDGNLVVYTEQTIVDRSALAAEISKVAERGWAQAVGEREEDLNAIAAPVLDTTGRLRAVLGVQGPALRFRPRAMRAAVDPLTQRAALITETL
ncbi:MAG TPA: IclR family transcriptional regulator [Pseudonocardia sp.]|jgi:DNA-binding IclR family transcriptional regulator|uniref:IclR family transcriptional regulator n=1 Tax=Pseudonocardia sp. TaxID=60912 RepID=UPI002B520E80|nr:IclR family transcriptional regulator [Pseudonocardia sp.]HTF53903.1 IclR family transcriptional regulator [Pseudonocardia sp.]